MGEKAKVKETIGLYSKLWQLPTFRGIVIRIVLAVALGALLSTAVRLLSGPVLNPPAYLCYYLMLLVVPVFVGYALMYALVRKPGSPLDARRTTGIVQMGVYIWILIGLVGTVIAAITVNPYTEVRLWSAGMVAAFLLFTFLATGLSDHHPLRNTAATLMPPLLWYVTVLTLVHSVPSFLSLSPFWWVSAVLSFALCSIGVNHIFRAVSRPFERDLGISGPELLRSFGYDYLVGDPCPFEQLMSKIATVQDVPIEVVVIKRGPTLAAVGVVLYVHPGPFRDLGSSALPSAVIRDIQNTFGVPAFVMHGTCTHHQNLTTSQDFDVVMAEIHRLIGEVKCYERVSGPHWTESGKFKTWTLFAGHDMLAVTTSAPDFTDDIALEVGVQAADQTRRRVPSLGQVAIVDAHNSISDDAVSVMSGDPEAAMFADSISEAAARTVDMPQTSIEAGVCQIVPEGVTKKDGLGPGGITALVLKQANNTTAFVSVDGNNAEPGFREEMVSMLRRQGVDSAELLTTDTHVVNAISLSSRGYPPVGKAKKQEVLQAIAEAVGCARSKLGEVSLGLGFGAVRGIRTFGEKGFDTLTGDIVEAAGIAKRTGLRTALICYILSLVTMLLF